MHAVPIKLSRWLRCLIQSFLLPSLVFAVTPAAQGEALGIDNFALLDHRGVQHELRRFGDSKAVVFIATDTQCRHNLDQLHKYRLLQTRWQDQSVTFLAINSSPHDSRDDIRHWATSYDVDMPVLLDSSQLVAANLGLSRAGELVVVEPTLARVLYRGGLDADVETDNKPLRELLARVVSAEPGLSSEVVLTAAEGCGIDYQWPRDEPERTPDYASDVAPILIKQCSACHVENGIAPFAMDSHTMVQGWSPMIKEVLLTRRMPPAQVDPHVRHFSTARYITDAELRTLVRWIDAGAPRGDGDHDPLTRLTAAKSQWQLGEPDYIVEVPAFRVPATGVLDYENVTINLPFTTDKWVRAVQHIPGDRRALHHLLSFIVPADYEARIVEGENDQYRAFLEGYAPGKEAAATYPDNTGVFIPAGSAVQMSLHYTTYGRETLDRTRLGLYFADEPPEHRYATYALSHGGTNLTIPPGVSDYPMSASHVFEQDVVLHGLRPHMHYRGKSMRFSVVFPDGRREEILNVPNYSFAWQPTYRLEEPVLLPAGTRVMISGKFDNSAYNLGNPDPAAEVRGGAQSWDEMFIGYFSYHLLQ